MRIANHPAGIASLEEHGRGIPIGFAHRLRDGIAGSELVTYADAGHVPMEELPEATAQDAERFLASPD